MKRYSLGRLSEAIRAAGVEIDRARTDQDREAAVDWLAESVGDVVRLYGLEALDSILCSKKPLARLDAMQRAKWHR